MKKKLLTLFMSVVMLLSVLTVGVTAESLTDVPDGYIGIYTKDDLDNIKLDMSGKYILMNDIVFEDSDYEKDGSFYNSGKGWAPIGTPSKPFKGKLDGNDFEIVNLKITDPTSYNLGLFGYTESATITNVKMKNANILGGSYTGGIVGCAKYYTTISNCTVEGNIAGNQYIGGICGELDAWSTWSGSYYNTIEKCLNLATVTGTFAVGGICGCMKESSGYARIRRCVNNGNISGNTDQSSYVGGICGYTYGDTSSYNQFTNVIETTTTNCYNTGTVSGYNHIGGIIGGGEYFYVGYSYSVGKITAEKNYGGCFGNNPYSTTGCYYLEDAASEPDCLTGTPKSADQLRKQGTFEQWDFDTVWTMEGREDYPYPELRDVPLVLPDDSKTEITGTVTVKGEAKVGSTLTAEITDISSADATFSYEWKADGKIVGTNASYTVTQDDVGKNITLTIKGNGDFKGNFTSSAIVGECVHSVPEFTNNNDASCAGNATKTGVCEKCNATVTEEIEDTMLAHTFKNYVYDNNATCTADGTKTAKCENCNATDTITAENTMVEHTYIADVTEATCYENGEIIYTCSCGDSYSKAIYSAGHIDSNEDGICDVCAEEISEDCGCSCHKSGIAGFFWKIMNFFYKLFGTNKTCECGVNHW